MTEKQAQQETRYRLIMILVKSMERDGLISTGEREAIRKKLVERLKPLVGQLEQPEVRL